MSSFINSPHLLDEIELNVWRRGSGRVSYVLVLHDNKNHRSFLLRLGHVHFCPTCLTCSCFIVSHPQVLLSGVANPTSAVANEAERPGNGKKNSNNCTILQDQVDLNQQIMKQKQQPSFATVFFIFAFVRVSSLLVYKVKIGAVPSLR